MAACGSLQHIFDNQLPESPKSPFSLSAWNKITTSMKPPIDESSLTQLFGELHFKENNNHVVGHSTLSSPVPLSSPLSSLPSSPTSSFIDANQQPGIGSFGLNNDKNGSSSNNNNIQRSQSDAECYYPTSQKKKYRHSDSFSSMNSESLSLCTEGLGFESSDDGLDWQPQREEKRVITRHRQPENLYSEFRRPRTTRGSSYPPPISCIGRNGKPWVCFKSYRQDGRFILKEIRIPTQEFLHACREDGRLKLHLVQSDDEFIDGDDDDDWDDEIDRGIEGVDQADEGKAEDGDGDGDANEEQKQAAEKGFSD